MKKIGSILVLVFFLMTLISVTPAFAAVATVYTEDFNDAAGWGPNGVITASELYETWQGNGTLSRVAGYEGNAIKFAANDTYTNSSLVSKKLSALDYSDEKTFVYTSKIRFEGIPDSAFYLGINHGTQYNGWAFYVGVYNGQYVFANSGTRLSEGIAIGDDWYDMVMTMSGSDIITKVYDFAGNLITDWHVAGTDILTNVNRAITCFINGLNTAGCVLMDATTLYCVDNSNDTFNFVAYGSTAVNSVIATDGSITLAFDQPVTPAKTDFVVKDASLNTVSGAVESVRVKDFNTVIVKLSGLNYSSAYKLDYSGMTSAAGMTLDSVENTLNFKTVEKKVYTENFNDAAGWTNNGSITSSEIYETWQGNGTLSRAAGYEGNAIKFAANNTYTNSSLVSKKLSGLGYSDGKTFVYTSKIRFEGTPDSAFYLGINHGTSYNGWAFYAGVYNGQYVFASSENKLSEGIAIGDDWYDVVMTISGSDIITKVYDSAGNLIKNWYVADTDILTNVNRAITCFINGLNTAGCVLMDAAALYCVNNSTDTFNFVASGSTAANSVIATDGSITLAFNQPVTAAITDFVVKDASLNTVPGAVESVRVKDFNTVIVKLSGLDYSSAYKLDYSDVTSVTGMTLDGGENTLDFTTVDRKVYTEDFNDVAGWGANGVITASEMYETWQGNGTLSRAAGYEGNAIKFAANNTYTNSSLVTKKLLSLGYSDEKTFVYTSKIRFEGTPDSAFYLGINHGTQYNGWAFYAGVYNGQYVFTSSGSRLSEGIALGDDWYDVVMTMSGSDIITKVYDSAGNYIKSWHVAGTDILTNVNRAITYFINGLNTAGCVLMDAATLYCVDNSTDTFNFVVSGSTAANSVIATDGSITLAFNQPIAAAITDFVVKDAFLNTVPGAVESVRVKDFNTAVVKLNGLSSRASYTIDFSGITSVAGTSLTGGTRSISFRSMANGVFSQNYTASIYTDFTGTEFSENGGIAKNTALTIEIVNEWGAAFSGKLIYAFYNENGVLEGVEMGGKIIFTADEETKTVSYTTQSAHPDAQKLKVMLWDNDKILKPLAVNITAQKATGADGPSTQYKNFGEQPDDKLKEQMPVPFDIDNYSMTEIAGYNFDNFDFSENGGNACGAFVQSYSTGLWSIVQSGGIDNSPCVKLEMSEEVTATRFQLALRSTDAKQGDWYCLKFKVKGEGLTENGRLRPYLEIADSSNTTVVSGYGEKISGSDANEDWTECYVTEMIPLIANNIEDESEFYTIYLNAFMNDMPSGSVAYIDDITLCRFNVDTMDTVLVTPNYKGFVYGDNGVCDINLRINLNDYNGSCNLSDFSIECSLVDEKDYVYSAMHTENAEKVNDVTFSSAVLPGGEGDYYLKTVLKDKTSGDEIQKQEWTIRKRAADYRPKVYVDEYNRFIKDGQAMLPVFQYAHGNIYEEYVDVTKNTPVDAFTVAGSYHTAYRTPQMQRLRKSMSENNLGAMLETCGYVYSHLYTGLPKTNVKKQSDIRSLLTVMLNNFKDDPRLWAYRNFDEENAVYYGEELRWQNDIMAAVDPDHPTTGITDRLISGRPGIYSKTADIIGVDPYYCTGKDNQDLSKVGNMIKSFKELNPNRPVFVTLQGFWYQDRGDLRGPTQQEYRNMAWQALCEGVTAIDNYSYTDLKNNPWGGKDAQTLWAEQMEVLGEIKEFEPVLLSTLPAPYYKISENTEGVKIRTARYNGKSYVFAVNVNNSVNTLKIKLNNVSSALEYYTKDNFTADASGYFNIDMEPYGVVILEAEQGDYLSSYAEIIRFGVSNGNKSYAVTDSASNNPVICINDSTSWLDYKVTASDYTSLYINGSVAEKQGRINIDGLSSITVKAISQDGINTTEKEYIIARK